MRSPPAEARDPKDIDRPLRGSRGNEDSAEAFTEFRIRSPPGERVQQARKNIYRPTEPLSCTRATTVVKAKERDASFSLSGTRAWTPSEVLPLNSNRPAHNSKDGNAEDSPFGLGSPARCPSRLRPPVHPLSLDRHADSSVPLDISRYNTSPRSGSRSGVQQSRHARSFR